MLTLTFLSDTHNQLDKLLIPKCDLILHTGDLTMSGTFKQLAKAANDLQNLKKRGICKEVIVTGGNHDFGLENDYACESLFSDMIYLRNSSCEYKGLKIFGSPFSPTYGAWAFMRNRGSDIAYIWSKIPDDTDILLTHSPCNNILDLTPRGIHAGCEELLKRVSSVKPLIHASGHLHLNGGNYLNYNKTLFINCAVCDESYDPTNKIITVEIDEVNKKIISINSTTPIKFEDRRIDFRETKLYNLE